MLPDYRLRFQAPLIDFENHVGTTGQAHDNFPAPRTQARYDQLRLYLQALLANQASFDQPVEFSIGSLWYNLNTNTLQIQDNNGWEGLAHVINLDTGLNLQQWYTAVKTVLTGSPNNPDPFSKAVFITNEYSDPQWITSLDASKLTGSISASMLTGTLNPSLFPPLTIGTNVGGSNPGSLLLVNNSGLLSQAGLIGIGGSGATIRNVSLTNNTATITTISAHNFAVGDQVTISGLAHTALNGTWIVSDTPTTITFTFAITNSNIISVADNGVAVKYATYINALAYSSVLQAVQINTAQNAQSLTINQTVTGHDAGIALMLQNAVQTVLGTAGSTNSGIIGSIVGDTYIVANGNLRLSANNGSTAGIVLDQNSVVNIGSAHGANQLVANQTSPSWPVMFVMERAGISYLSYGLAGDPSTNNNVISGAALNDTVFQTRSGSYFFAVGGDTSQLTIASDGVTVEGTLVSSGALTCASFSTGAVSCGAVNATSLNATGTVTCTGLSVNTGTISGIGSGLINIPQSAIAGLESSFSSKANDNAVVHLTGNESITGGKVITASSSTTVPLALIGAASQTANLLELRDNSNSLKASISQTGVFTGDGSGLSGISISIGTLSGVLPLQNGGTGANALLDPGQAQTNLGLAIGTNVQAWSAVLDNVVSLANVQGSLLASTSGGWVASPVGTNGSYAITDHTQACGIGWTTTLTNPGAGSGSERFGEGATAVGAASTVVGNGASAPGANAVVMGNTASGALNAVVLGTNASGVANTVCVGNSVSGLGSYSIAIGNASTSNNAHDIVIGDSAVGHVSGSGSALVVGQGAIGYGTSIVIGHGGVTGNNLSSIVLGTGAAATGSNQFVVGSSSNVISNVFLGGGITNTSVASVIINATGGSGSNAAGSNLTLAGGISTGTGAGGAIIFQYSPSGASGSSQNTLTTCGQFSSYGVFSALYGAIITPGSSTAVPLIVKGASSGTANLQQWQSNDGTVLASVSNTGGMALNSLALSSTTASNLLSIQLGATAPSIAGGTIAGVAIAVSESATNNYGGLFTITGGSATNYGIVSNVTSASGSNNICFAGAISGTTTGNNNGVYVDVSGGTMNTGVAGLATGGGGSSNYGLYGLAITSTSGTNVGVFGQASGGTAGSWAGQFLGPLMVAVNSSNANHHIVEVRNTSNTILGGVDQSGNPTGTLHSNVVAEGRLSLVQSNPFPSWSGTLIAGSTIYYIPYVGDRITIVNSSTLLPETMSIPSSGLSYNLAGCAANTNYDVFVINNGDGTMSLSVPLGSAWGTVAGGTSDPTGNASRASSYTLVQASNGMLTRLNYPNWRYVGTIRCYATSTCIDTPNMAFVWNYNNRQQKKLAMAISTTSWTNSYSCFAPMNQSGTTDYKHIQFIIGYQDGVMVDLTAFLTATSASAGARVGISLNPNLSTGLCGWSSTADIDGLTSISNSTIQARTITNLPAGYHYATALEGTASSGTSTFASNQAGLTSGIVGYYTG